MDVRKSLARERGPIGVVRSLARERDAMGCESGPHLSSGVPWGVNALASAVAHPWGVREAPMGNGDGVPWGVRA